MNDKLTIILTFISSVLLPFIRDFVDLWKAVKPHFMDDLSNLQREMDGFRSEFADFKRGAAAAAPKSAVSKAKDEDREIKKPSQSPFSRFLSGSR